LLDNLVSDLRAEVVDHLSNAVGVTDSEHFPNLSHINRGHWVRMEDVVAVVADLKASTRLGMNRYVNTTLRLYQAATGCGVKMAARFDPAFIDIQGDGFFCLFHGEMAHERAAAAAMALAFFSKEVLEPSIRDHLGPGCPPTGLKVGVAMGRLAVGSVGVRASAELVWPGKPVNWAFKCSGAAGRHQVVVTENVFDQIVWPNEFLKRPCYLSGHFHGNWPSGELWRPIGVKALPGVRCYERQEPWCPEVADRFCTALLAGHSQQSTSGWQRFRYSMGL
jgi:class 3 adenylate cyclase